jgi:hypothetical protein
MPRYYFDLAAHKKDTDKWGSELDDDAAARVRAVNFAATYLRDRPELILDSKELRVVVRTEDDRTLFTVVALSVDSA